MFVLMAVTAGCSGGGSEAEQSPAASQSVPARVQTVYLATALSCSRLPEFPGTKFTPLKVEGAGYSITVEPKQGGVENAVFSSYVYEVPVAAQAAVRITPGTQPGVELSPQQFQDGAATVFYAVDSGDMFKVSVVRPGKDEAVKKAQP